MTYQAKPNTGSLFKNQKKVKETHPNMTGAALIGGVEYWVSAWTKDGQKGKWISLSFTPKEYKAGIKESKNDLGDIPF